MTIQQLKKVHGARPFRPYRIHIADGRSIDVQHPELLAHSPGGRTIAVAHPDDTFEILDLLLVTSLEVLNGKSKSTRRKP